jgi:hypothetical protein
VAFVSVVGFVAFVAASAWVGARLLALAARTREVPELAIGSALVLGATGFTGLIAAFRLHLVPEPALATVYAVSTGASAIGVLALELGTWTLFRPGSRAVAVAFALSAVTLLASVVAGVATFRPDGHRTAFVFWSFNCVGAAAYAWGAAECFHYHALLRRRARIGLSDLSLAHRFLLWAIAGCGGAAVFGAGMFGRAVIGGPHAAVAFAQSLAGLVAAVAIWLAFFPPRAYLRAVTGPRASDT